MRAWGIAQESESACKEALKARFNRVVDRAHPYVDSRFQRFFFR
jgi:hypothetical protein